ncbi:trypsin domain-containing protein [Phthorimaea operculella]|nr:trypsin domain-containing protein [Phthorimaea operculella]
MKEPQRRDRRVQFGKDVTNAKYPYIVAIGSACGEPQRICTGTLIAPGWVLTAGHCIDKERLKYWKVYYGDLTKFPNTTYAQIIKDGYVAPNYNFKSLETAKRKQYISVRNDVGLLMIEEIPDPKFGKLSLTDYWSLIGYPVRHVGAGRFNISDEIAYNTSPLKEGEAVVVKCGSAPAPSAPNLCLRPKCSNSHQKSLQGDAGGPVLYKGRIVGVCCCRARDDTALYTALSPYGNWIQGTIEKVEQDLVEKENKEKAQRTGRG